MTALTAWQTFYEIVGSSAGALIGLQFVVISLFASRQNAAPPSSGAGEAYATPNIVHFAAVLGLAAALSAPWDNATVPAILWGVAGLGGTVYAVVTAVRMRRQHAYRPEFEDWLFHVFMPFAAYLLLAASAWLAQARLKDALFGVALAALLLLFAGIHNAWDAVTYHVFVKARENK